jgi:hypothetical protein
MPTTTGAVIFIIVPFTDARVGADGRARARRFVVVVVFVVVVAVVLVRARIVVAIARVIAPSVDVSRQTRTRRTVARTDSRASSSSSSTRIPSDTARRLAASIRSSGTRPVVRYACISFIHSFLSFIHRQTAPSI